MAGVKSHSLPEAWVRRAAWQREEVGRLTAADPSSSPALCLSRQEAGAAGRTCSGTAACLPDPCPRFFSFQVRGRGAGDAGLGSELIRGAVCEGGCLLDALILVGAGVFFEAT